MVLVCGDVVERQGQELSGLVAISCKGGAIDVIVWQTGTARLLSRLLEGRKSGALFVTERNARVQVLVVDLDSSGHARLSCQ